MLESPGGAPEVANCRRGRWGKRRASRGLVARRFLLPVQPFKFPAELVEVLALGGKPVDFPELVVEPRCPLGLLYKQLSRARRGHVHLPFLDALRRFAFALAGWDDVLADVSNRAPCRPVHLAPVELYPATGPGL